MRNIKNKLILITGASSGIGKQAAIELSKEGAKIILVARREEQLKEVMLQLDGVGHSYYCFDLTEIEKIETLLNKIVLEQGPLDGFVHCAGIAVNRSISMFKYEQVLKSMQLNFFSYYELVRMIQKKGNFNTGLSIVAISSVAAHFGSTAQSVYSASKGAIESASRCFAKELSQKGIRVNMIAPAAIKTDMYGNYQKMKADLLDGTMDISPRQYLNMGEPYDIAMGIVYLISPESKFVTGTCISIDGGYSSC